MIILTIRTDKPEAEIGLYDDERQLVHHTWQAHRQLAETLHQAIKDILKKSQHGWSDLKGVVVYQGPGSFTGLRIGVSVANALAYSEQIPIVGSTEEKWARHGIQKLVQGEDDR